MSVFYRDIDVNISDYKSELSKPLVVFERDRGLEIYFNLIRYAYRFDKNPSNLLENLVGAYATVTLVNPSGYEIGINEVEITEDAKVKFVITEDLTDELTEIGTYQLQIHINNDVEGRDTSVFSIPPFNFEVIERLKGIKNELLDSEGNGLTDSEGYQLVSATSNKVINFPANKINEYLNSIPIMQSEIKNLNSQLEQKANKNTFNLNEVLNSIKYEYVFHDNFYRENNSESLGHNGDNNEDRSYTVSSVNNKAKLGIANNFATVTFQGDSNERVIAIKDMKANNGIIEEVVEMASGDAVGIAFRVTDVHNMYILRLTINTIQILKYEKGSSTSLATKNFDTINNAKLTLELKDDYICAYLDGAKILDINNTFNQNETKHGLFFYSNSKAKVKSLTFKNRINWGLPDLYEDILDQGRLPFYIQKECPTNSYNFNFVSDTVNNSKKAIRFELNANDTIVDGGKRCELKLEPLNQLSEFVFSIDILLPNDYALDKEPEILIQFHDYPDNDSWDNVLSPPLALRTHNGEWELYRLWSSKKGCDNNMIATDGTTELINLGGYENDKGKWVTWTFHVKWGYEEYHCPFIKLYKNNNLVYENYGANTVNNVIGNYPKFGIYKWVWKNGQGNSDITNRVIYFDNFKFYK